ncbi:MAG: flippase-like domain-containing protein [Anaerolineaceae bacterium]|nr:flippase-like domain-containing protein [Anaerolineaceae bacterium]
MSSDLVSENAAAAQPSARKQKSRKWLIRLVSIVVTGALLLFLFSKLDWQRLLDMLRGISPLALVGALLAYGSQNFFRAIRFRVLLERDAPLRLLLPITFYHNFLVRVLPFKLGELSYIFLLRSRLNINLETSVSSLFGARILELMIIVLMTTIGFILSSGQAHGDAGLYPVLIPLLFVGCLLILYFAGALLRLATGITRRVLARILPNMPHLLTRIFAKLDDVAIAMDSLRQPRLFAKAFLVSFGTYGSAVVLNYIMLRSVGVDVPIFVMITILSMGQFASAFPFSVSGFGVVEGGWALGLLLFTNTPTDDAVAIGFLLHGFQVLAATIYGTLGYLAVRMQPPVEGEGESHAA